MVRKIKLGAGVSPRPGNIYLDIRPGQRNPIVADMRFPPLLSDSVEEIIMRHHLERFTEKEANEILDQCFRMLQLGCILNIIVPNIEFHMWQFFHGNRQWAMAGFWGWQENDFDIHKWDYTFALLQEKLQKAGLESIENLTALRGSIERDDKHLEVRCVCVKGEGDKSHGD